MGGTCFRSSVTILALIMAWQLNSVQAQVNEFDEPSLALRVIVDGQAVALGVDQVAKLIKNEIGPLQMVM